MPFRARVLAGLMFVGLTLSSAADSQAIFYSGFECVGLQCDQVACAPGSSTTLTGVVYAPNGFTPLPNVRVYVPNAPLAALPDGASCDRCETPPSGDPVVMTTTASDGSFTLGDVPVGTDVPVVVLAGKWRRQVVVPAVAACAETVLSEEATRLPRNQVEGDIPRIAVVTGGADAIECLVRRIGIDAAEYGIAGSQARVHLFAGAGGTNQFDSDNGGAAFTAAASTLWTSFDQLAGYDHVLLGCEGTQEAASKPPNAREALKAYVDGGGRVFASHLQNYFIEMGPPPWPDVATWAPQNNPGPLQMDIDSSFAQGQSLANWLFLVGATPSPDGQLQVVETRHTAVAIDTGLARRWIHRSTTPDGQPTEQLFTFTAPIELPPAQQCGRMVFSDIHHIGDSSQTGLGFPSGGCTSPIDAVPAQSQALLYMLFDLGRCVGTTRE